jgi:Flp pilus assembly protein TadD
MSERHPDRVEGLRLVAHTLFQMGDYQESVKHYRQALSLDPRNPIFLEELGNGLHQLKRMDEAIETLHEARAVSPTRPRPYALLGMIHYRQRRYPEAVAELQRAVSLGGRDWHTLGWLCHAYEANLQFDQSTNCWRSFTARFPDEVVPLPSLPEVLNNVWIAERRR